MRQAPFAFRLPVNVADPMVWFGIGLCLIVLVPIIPIAPWLQTFVHTWRPELAASLFTGGFLIWAYRNDAFHRFLAGISKPELFAIILPCSIFTAWSFVSALYAGSWRSVIHHSGVWGVYIVFYVLARFLAARTGNTKTLFFVLAAVVWMIGLPAIFEYYSSVTSGVATTIGIRYSKYAELLNTLFPVVLAYSLRLKGKAFWFGAFTVLLVWLLDISSLSRTGMGLYIAGILAVTAVIFALKRFHHYRKKLSVLLVVLFVVPVLLHLPSFFGSKGNILVDRVQNQAAAESTNVRPFFSKIAFQMFKTNPLTGVGADNFGQEFIKYRAVYAAENPTDPNLAIAEAESPERAHNEFTQIAAELGIPGLAFFGWFLAGIAFLFFMGLRRFRTVSLSTICAMIGVVLFLASSLVTSYSFRILQNGLVFFIVLAIAIQGILSKNPGNKQVEGASLRPAIGRFAFPVAILCCSLLALLSIVRAAAVVYVYQAAGNTSAGEAAASFKTSFALDDQNASAWSVYGMYFFREGKFAEAAPQFRRSVDLGRATTADYSYLASTQFLAGDGQAAESTLAEGLRVYPASVFMRTRYAVLLSEAGRTPEADEQFRIARDLDARQAETWRNLIADGAKAASQRSFDNHLLLVMDLKPKNGIYAVLAEREIRHPEEKAGFQF